MLDIRLDPQGTERLIAGLRRVSEVSTARRLIQAASRDALQPVAKQARVLVPQPPAPYAWGDLRDSIKVRSAPLRARTWSRAKTVVVVTAGQWYAHLVEFATVRTRAQPFLAPAWRAGREQAQADFSGHLWRAIGRAVARHARASAGGRAGRR